MSISANRLGTRISLFVLPVHVLGRVGDLEPSPYKSYALSPGCLLRIYVVGEVVDF